MLGNWIRGQKGCLEFKTTRTRKAKERKISARLSSYLQSSALRKQTAHSRHAGLATIQPTNQCWILPTATSVPGRNSCTSEMRVLGWWLAYPTCCVQPLLHFSPPYTCNAMQLMHNHPSIYIYIYNGSTTPLLCMSIY